VHPRLSYAVEASGDNIVTRAHLPRAGLEFERRLEIRETLIIVAETVTNVAACDRPIGWTQHVTLGPPFLEHGLTEFRTSATQSCVFETPFGAADYLVAGADFDWPSAPRIDGGMADLSRSTAAPCSSARTRRFPVARHLGGEPQPHSAPGGTVRK